MSKFYIVLSCDNDGNREHAKTEAFTTDENGEVTFEQNCELETTLVKNSRAKGRKFESKNLHIELRKIKYNKEMAAVGTKPCSKLSFKNDKKTGSLKLDLAHYAIQKQIHQQTLQFTKWLVLFRC